MLILARRIGESCMIGGVIEVTVLGIKGSQVRLGFNAPTDIEIHRTEIWERLQAEKKSGGSGVLHTKAKP